MKVLERSKMSFSRRKSAVNLGRVLGRRKFVKNEERLFRPDFNEDLRFHYSVCFLNSYHGPGAVPGAGGKR